MSVDRAKRAHFGPTKDKFVRDMEAKAEATREKALAKRRENTVLKKAEKEAAGGAKSKGKTAKGKARSKGLKGGKISKVAKTPIAWSKTSTKAKPKTLGVEEEEESEEEEGEEEEEVEAEAEEYLPRFCTFKFT